MKQPNILGGQPAYIGNVSSYISILENNVFIDSSSDKITNLRLVVEVTR